MLPTGTVEVVTGSSPHGQGHETAWSQIVADRLGVAFEDVEVLHGDTQTSPKGMDTYGSRSLTVGGIALVKATDKVVEKARKIAAHMLECTEADLDYVRGKFTIKGTDKHTTVSEVALRVFAAHDLPDGVEPGLDSDATFDPENFSFPHGTHLCAARGGYPDRLGEDPQLRLRGRRRHCGESADRRGQVQGGLAQGIAQALFEEAVYDEGGTLTTATLADYLVPSAVDLPHFTTDRTETPATTNPLGVKGVGEAGTIASTPAVVNAVLDAVRHLGVADIDMPCSPQRVWRAVQSARGAVKSTSDHATEAAAGGGLGSIDAQASDAPGGVR